MTSKVINKEQILEKIALSIGDKCLHLPKVKLEDDGVEQTPYLFGSSDELLNFCPLLLHAK